MLRVLTFAVSAALGALAALWAYLAVQTAVPPWKFDGNCYEVVPHWVVAQAALAAVGVALLIRLVVAHLRRKRTPRTTWVVWNFTVLAAVLAAWCFVAIELVTTGDKILCPGAPPSSLW